MIVHVVLFKFPESADAERARARLLTMSGKIPGLISVETGLDVTRSARSYDLALITRHTSKEALAAYQTHPVHVEVATFIRERMNGAAAVDFEAEAES